MQIIKEIILCWFICDAVLLIISKNWRRERIDYLKKLDKKS